MTTIKNFFATRWGIISVGAFIGVFAPLLQLFLAGEGDGDAAVFVLGMIVGAAFAHNFGLASSADGVGPYGIVAVVIGFLTCLFIGFTMRKEVAVA